MTLDYIPISNLKRYPEIYVTKYLKTHVQKYGLIEPLVIKDGEIIENQRQLFEAFARFSGCETIIAVHWHNLSKNDKFLAFYG